MNFSDIKKIDITAYDYELPASRIAKYPLENRDQSKLLRYTKGKTEDHVFSELPELIPADAALYFNNTKVIYARLPFRKPTGAHIEIFCLEPDTPSDYVMNLTSKNKCRWKCLAGNLKKWKSGALQLANHENLGLEATLLARAEDHIVVEFCWSANQSFAEILAQAGDVPIPPYLKRASEAQDKETYQTMYSRIEGSVAAPTAGLHFTPAIFEKLDAKGILQHEVTLHVGAGTFKPVDSEKITGHEMHREFIHVTRPVVESLLNDKQIVYAVGTTTVRTLESLFWIGKQIFERMPETEKIFQVQQWEPYEAEFSLPKNDALQAILRYMDIFNTDYITGNTSIIIVPGYKHKIVNGLLTNFHQPKSTLLLLLASFVGSDWKKMYAHALEQNYRFLSYGDSCLINHN